MCLMAGLCFGLLGFGLLACDNRAATINQSNQCHHIEFEANTYVVCRYNVSGPNHIKLYLKHPDGEAYATFARLKTELMRHRKTLIFAMNAGMYHEDRRPVGLFVEDGETISALPNKEMSGNFGLKPNGVFWIDDTSMGVMETATFEKHVKSSHMPRYATQSGPMLVIEGQLHPAFKADSQSLNIRNGVGMSPDQKEVVFVISQTKVNFHSFARLFRDKLNINNALYLDGSVSKIYSQQLNRHDTGLDMGPMVAVSVDK